MNKDIRLYKTPEGNVPFRDWILSLKDRKGKAAVLERINRLRKGLLGLWRRLGNIYELKVNVGPGYRIYFGEHDKTIIVLLIGGSKKTQNKDIALAKKYWKDYQERFK